MSYQVNIFYWSKGSSYHPVKVSCDTPMEVMELIQKVDVEGKNIKLDRPDFCKGAPDNTGKLMWKEMEERLEKMP